MNTNGSRFQISLLKDFLKIFYDFQIYKEVERII